MSTPVTVNPDVITAATYPNLDYDFIAIQKNRQTGKTQVTAIVRKYHLAADGVTKSLSPLTTRMNEADLNAFLAANSDIAAGFTAIDTALQTSIAAYGRKKGTF